MIIFKERKQFTNTNYMFLGAANDYKEYKTYLKMLFSAFKNKQTNIGLCGPYGSGKSSVIKTYIKNQKHFAHKKKKFLNISLAAFSVKGKLSEKDYNKIEKSILQQLFYKVKSHKLPYSRFNKITNVRLSYISIVILLLSLVTLATVYIVNPVSFLNNLARFLFLRKCFSHIGYTIACFVSLFGILFSISLVVKFIIQNLKISKLGFKSAEIVLGKNDSSVFNKYLDEIIYFFEVSKYDVIVFEDLDRFKNANIFIKLRELNYLINNSNKIKKPIYFIYAIGDSIFKEKERTKFFDIIIPVIPVVNNTNSGEKLLAIVKDNDLEKELTKDFIYNISPHVDDMRILKSVVNEYLLYKEKISLSGLKFTSLFSLMLYKNVHSKDFERLQMNEGEVKKIFADKNEAIRTIDKETSLKIVELEKKIQRAKKEHLRGIDELRWAFWHTLILSSTYTIRIDNNFIRNENEAKGFNFDTLKNFNKITLMHRNNAVQNKEFTFDEFNTEYCFDGFTFYDRYLALKDGVESYIKELSTLIDNLKEEKRILNNLNMVDFLMKYDTEYFKDFDKNSNSLLIFLLREGYIKEDYIKYVSNFYEGKLTHGDVKFVLSVHNRNKLENDYSLSQIDAVIEYLHSRYFLNREILNYDLLNYMIQNPKYHDIKYANMLSQLFNLDEFAISFIIEYFNSKSYNELFIKIICNNCENFWCAIKHKGGFDKDKLNEFLIQIVLNVDIDDIIKMNDHVYEVNGEEITNSISEYLNSLDNAISLLYDGTNLEKLTLIIKELDLQFAIINENDVNTPVFDYIAKNGYFDLNVEMLHIILKKYTSESEHMISTISNNSDDPNFINSLINYSAIQFTNENGLIDNINSRIEEYLEKIYFVVKDMGFEDQKKVLALLELNDLDALYKKKFIEVAEFLLDDIESVNSEFWSDILSNKKVDFMWKNIFLYFDEYELDNTLVDYLNFSIPRLAEENSIDYEGYEDIYKKMYNPILLSDYIESDETIDKLITSRFKFNNFTVTGISNERVRILINKDIIEFNPENYTFIADSYKDCLLAFVEKNEVGFFDDLTLYDLSSNLINSILQSSNINTNNLFKLICHLNEQNYTCQSSTFAEIIIDILTTYEPFELCKELRESLFSAEISVEYKLKLINNFHETIKITEFRYALDNLGVDFIEIGLRDGKRPKVNINKYLIDFAQILKSYNIISSFKVEKNYIRFNNHRHS